MPGNVRRGSGEKLVALHEGWGPDLLASRGTCGQRGEVTVVFCVTQEQEQDYSPSEHTAGGQAPADGARRGCVRGGTGRPPRWECLAPRDLQLEPQCENKSHRGDCVSDTFLGSHEAGEGVTGENGAFPQGFPILLFC